MDIFGNFTNLKGDARRRKVRAITDLEFSFSDLNEDSIGEIEEKEEKAYFSAFLGKLLLCLLFCILIFKLFSLQVVQGEFNQKLAEGNRIRPRIIEAKRGVITDSDGDWLARNKPSFSLAIYPSDLPKKKTEREEVFNKLSQICGIPVADIRKEVEDFGLMSLDMVTISENIPHEEALVMEKKIVGLPGVFMAKQAIREYASLPGLAHLLGYTSRVSVDDLKANPDYLMSDRIGKTGLEYEYEKYLKGKNGIEQIEVDSKGTVVRILVDEESEKPEPGLDLQLYLDGNLQTIVAQALKNGISEGKKTLGEEQVHAGVAVVMDVKTGGILSMVSLPDYDNNLFATKISNQDYVKLSQDKTYPMFNRAIKGTYPPGSIVKIVMAAAGLSEKVISKSTSFDTPAAIQIGEYSFPDWKDHGNTDIERAIAESNNIFFYAIGGGFDKIKGIGIDNIKKYWQLFGLGEKTGIDLPGEANGLLPDAAWKKKVKKESWYLGDTYHASIGQGDLLVTPIQMLRATATIANGGKLLQPHLVKKIIDHSGNVIKEFVPRIERDNFISADVIKTIQEGMRMTVTEGSARNLDDLPVSVAGKTGTAQFLNNEKTHAWFECYAPYENPQIAILVMVEGGGGGHEIAAPVAREILNYYFARQ